MIDTLLFLGRLGAPEIIGIVLVVLILFGGKRIPELMKGIGKGIREFRTGINNADTGDENSEKKE